MLRRLLSYFIPINVTTRPSSWSKNLEVTWNNGQLVLDSANTNYSFGSLQRILRLGLKHIGFDTINKMQHVLVLGVAGGSVIRTLTDEAKFKGRITGVDIDKSVIDLANEFFELDKIPNLQIHIDDAFEFVLRTQDKYELIIIDIFQDTVMPNFIFESFFTRRLHYLLQESGVLLFNTMLIQDEDESRNRQFIEELDKLNFSIEVIPRVENHNELIIARKRTS